MNYLTEYEDLEILLNFSGGIDSTYLLWKLLSENKKILVHHCEIYNHENRTIPESIAVKNILNWLIDNNLKNFKYVQTGFNYGNSFYIVKDVEVISFMSSVLLRNPKLKKIKEIAVSANSEDETSSPNDISSIRRLKILDAILPKNSDVKLTYPIINMSKKNIISSMPKELFKMTWFCRTPNYFDKDNNQINSHFDYEKINSWEICKKCKTCKQVLSIV